MLLFSTSLMATEEPEYTVIQKTDTYEVRQYRPYLVAETLVEADIDDAGNEAFRILAGYIFGKNKSKTKMEMTAPVITEESEKIEMTAPVTSSGGEGRYLYQFVMPARYTLETLPEPEDDRVILREVPGRVLAVRTFSGFWSEDRFAKEEARLRDDLSRDDLTVLGEASLSRYNSPFTLWFLRRNEIWFPVDLQQ